MSSEILANFKFALNDVLMSDVRYGDEWEVIRVSHIDWVTFMPYANEVLDSTHENTVMVAKIFIKFKEAGWEGDGALQVGWIPTFMVNSDISFGALFWHVKQRNNGTSYVLLNKKEITPQNEDAVW